MDNSVAYRIGEVVGAVVAVSILIGVVVFFVIALVQAIRTGRKGWIIAAAICGLPVAAFIVLFLVGVVIGLSKAARNSGPGWTSTTRTNADLLTGPMTAVGGSLVPYEMSYPYIDAWKKHESANSAFDQLYDFHDRYVGVVAEEIGVGTPQLVCDLSQKNLTGKASKHTFTPARPITIDSRSWLTFDATATVSGIDFKYRYYVYSDSKYTFQILAWGIPSSFDSFSPISDRVAGSFKIPK